MYIQMNHRDSLDGLCRVCGRQVVTKAMKVKHLCADYVDNLMAVFKISTVSDDPDIHPRFFCHLCKLVVLKASNAVKQYQHRTVVFEGWCSHVESSCGVCHHYQSFQQGGR